MTSFNTIETPAGVPAKMWTRGVQVEEAALDQIRKLAALPVVWPHLAIMPDVHMGYGAAVGRGAHANQACTHPSPPRQAHGPQSAWSGSRAFQASKPYVTGSRSAAARAASLVRRTLPSPHT